METEQTLVHPGDGEKAMQNGYSERSKADNMPVSSNEDETTKRKKIASVASTGLNRDGAKIITVDDMPSEMIEAILRNVATSDLLSCRQMNRNWNEIASRIMRQRADIQIAFSLVGGELTQSIQYIPQQTLLKGFWPLVNEVSSLTFTDLVKCVELSTDFPFTSFRFKDVVKGDDFKRFLSIWGENIYSVAVKVEVVDDVEMLRALLQKAPNLKKLCIDFGTIGYCTQKTETDVHLFADSNEFQLPELNALRVTGSCEYFSGIISDILKVASNLNCFEKCSLDKDSVSKCIMDAKVLAVLQSRNKLHCLKDVNLLFKENLIDLLENVPQIMDLQLKSFELSITWIWDDDQLSGRAIKIINKIFESSKHSLLELKIPPLGLLPG